MAVDSARSVPEALSELKLQVGHGELPPQQNQEERSRRANLLLWQLALSSVFVDINYRMTAREQHLRQQSFFKFNRFHRSNADDEFHSAIDKSFETTDRETNASDHSNEQDVECGIQQGKNHGEDIRPFLLRFPMTVYGMTMGLGSHAIMWKNIASLPAMHNLHVPRVIGSLLWFLCLLHLTIITLIYCAKFVRWPKAVHLEFLHPVRSNFFAAPFIAALFLVIGAPKFITGDGSISSHVPRPDKVVHVREAFLFTAPLLLYEIHIYGRWLMSRVGRLSEIGNPTTQIAVVGNFVSATTFALAGWKEISIFLFTIGMMHQMVVFTVIFLRIPSNSVVGVQLRPSYFLFIAPPSVASIAWSHIQGNVDDLATILTFMGVFFLIIMISRASFFFTGVRFSLAWWAFTFPSAAISTSLVNYACSRSPDAQLYEMSHMDFPKIFSFCVVLVSSSTLVGIFACTVIQATSGKLFVKDEVVEPALHDLKEEGHQNKH